MTEAMPVLFLFGGTNSEHGVSCLTAAGVLHALDRNRFEPWCVGITRAGQWRVLDEALVSALVTVDGVLPELDPQAGEPVALVPGGELVRLVDGQVIGRPAVVFPLLHGAYGEDGSIQGLLEFYGLPYVGSGIAASAIGMDKALMKAFFDQHGFAQGPWQLVTDSQWRTDQAGVLDRLRALGLPLFVKPARAGSSYGISKVTTWDALPEAIGVARTHDPRVVVEASIDGREIELAVLGSNDGPTRVSRAGEIVVLEGEFYDVGAKYTPREGQTELRIPTSLEPATLERLQRFAVETFEALGAEGLSRVDFFLTPDQQVLVNEINTLPGFTSLSMYPMLWQAEGLDYQSLVAELLDLALGRPVGLR